VSIHGRITGHKNQKKMKGRPQFIESMGRSYESAGSRKGRSLTKSVAFEEMFVKMPIELLKSFTQREDGRKTSVLSLLEILPLLFERPLVCHTLSCKVLDLHLA
jgi:hypothetical protein